MVKAHFLSFAAGDQKYYKCLVNLCEQAKQFNLFSTIRGITDETLKKNTDFWNKHGEFIEDCNNKKLRGFGVWLWKPYIVKQQLEEMEENDILVYADAGCMLNIRGRQRLIEYFKIITESKYGSIGFKHNNEWVPRSPQEGHIERVWTKGCVFDHFNARTHEIANTSQLVGGTFILRKCEHVMKMVNLWYETCCNYELLLDEPYSMSSFPDFREHRHDQSIFSIIRKIHGSTTLDNEVYFGTVGWKSPKAINSPIWLFQMPHKIV